MRSHNSQFSKMIQGAHFSSEFFPVTDVFTSMAANSQVNPWLTPWSPIDGEPDAPLVNQCEPMDLGEEEQVVLSEEELCSCNDADDAESESHTESESDESFSSDDVEEQYCSEDDGAEEEPDNEDLLVSPVSRVPWREAIKNVDWNSKDARMRFFQMAKSQMHSREDHDEIRAIIAEIAQNFSQRYVQTTQLVHSDEVLF